MRADRSSWPRELAAPSAAPGTSHAIGSGANEVAAFLAARTGRHFRAGADAASPLGPRDLLVALADDLSDHHLDAIEATAGASIPGIIVGRDRRELQAKAVATLAALAAPVAAPPLRLEVTPHLPIGLVEGPGYALAGRHADPTALRNLLGKGDSLVCLTGHGDGIDGDLGPLVLCPLDQAFLSGQTARPPTCRISGHCHRCHAGLQAETLRSRQLHPSEIRARAMIWNTCIGWPSAESFVHRSFGAGVRLAASASLGALVTTSRISFASPVTIDALSAALLRGTPIGEAVAAHNASPDARRAGHRLLLFGDPLLRVAPRLAEHLTTAKPCPPAARPVARATPRPALRERTMTDDDGRLVEAFTRLRGERGADRSAAFAEICRSLAREGLEGLWARQGLGTGTRNADCPHCRGPASEHVLDLPGGAERHLLICRRCEVAADIPARPLVAVRLNDGGRCRITALEAGAGWLGAIVSRRCRPFATETRPWPQAADGTPARRVDLGAGPSDAPTTVAAVFLVGSSLHVFSRPFAAGAFARTLAEVPA